MADINFRVRITDPTTGVDASPTHGSLDRLLVSLIDEKSGRTISKEGVGTMGLIYLELSLTRESDSSTVHIKLCFFGLNNQLIFDEPSSIVTDDGGNTLSRSVIGLKPENQSNVLNSYVTITNVNSLLSVGEVDKASLGIRYQKYTSTAKVTILDIQPC